MILVVGAIGFRLPEDTVQLYPSYGGRVFPAMLLLPEECIRTRDLQWASGLPESFRSTEGLAELQVVRV